MIVASPALGLIMIGKLDTNKSNSRILKESGYIIVQIDDVWTACRVNKATPSQVRAGVRKFDAVIARQIPGISVGIITRPFLRRNK
jgi:hypothetical protein